MRKWNTFGSVSWLHGQKVADEPTRLRVMVNKGEDLYNSGRVASEQNRSGTVEVLYLERQHSRDRDNSQFSPAAITLAFLANEQTIL